MNWNRNERVANDKMRYVINIEDTSTISQGVISGTRKTDPADQSRITGAREAPKPAPGVGRVASRSGAPVQMACIAGERRNHGLPLPVLGVALWCLAAGGCSKPDPERVAASSQPAHEEDHPHGGRHCGAGASERGFRREELEGLRFRRAVWQGPTMDSHVAGWGRYETS